jgi:hypothetical protein
MTVTRIKVAQNAGTNDQFNLCRYFERCTENGLEINHVFGCQVPPCYVVCWDVAEAVNKLKQQTVSSDNQHAQDKARNRSKFYTA